MHIMWKVVALALFLFCDSVALAAPAAGAETVAGTVGWVFADAKPGTDPQAGYLRMFLDTDDGRRLPLDVDVLRRAGTDPYALLGKRVRAHVEAVEGAAAGAKPATKSAVTKLWPEDAPAGKATVAGDEGLRGSIPWQVLTCRYRGKPDVPVSASRLMTMFSDDAGHIGAYWKLVSKGLIDIHGTRVTPEWVEVPGAIDEYGLGVNFDIRRVVADCIAAHGLQAGADSRNIIVAMNGDTGCCAYGAPYLHGVRSGRTVLVPDWATELQGVLVHEMGHAFGLPHGNNSDLDDDAYDNPWDAMSGTYLRSVRDDGLVRAKFLNAYDLLTLGWMAPERRLQVTATASDLQLVPIGADTGSGHQVIILPVDASGRRYYTLEARNPAVAPLHEGNLPGAAVIIHEVAVGRPEPAWLVDRDVPPADESDNRGSMLQVGDVWQSPEGLHTVRVDRADGTGFRVSVEQHGAVRELPRLDQIGLSGAWADLAADGQGLVLTISPVEGDIYGSILFGGWYAYGQQSGNGHRWLTLLGWIPNQDMSMTASVYETQGGSFLDVQPTSTEEAGRAKIDVIDCNTLRMTYFVGNPPWVPILERHWGSMKLSRILARADCSVQGDVVDNKAPTALSGAWGNVVYPGQGFLLELSPGSRTLFGGWYTYAAPGAASPHRWYTLQGAITEPRQSRFRDVGIYLSTGGRFNKPANVETRRVGSVDIDFTSCDEATMSYRFTAGELAGRSGTVDLMRLHLFAPPGCSL